MGKIIKQYELKTSLNDKDDEFDYCLSACTFPMESTPPTPKCCYMYLIILLINSI